MSDAQSEIWALERSDPERDRRAETAAEAAEEAVDDLAFWILQGRRLRADGWKPGVPHGYAY